MNCTVWNDLNVANKHHYKHQCYFRLSLTSSKTSIWHQSGLETRFLCQHSGGSPSMTSLLRLEDPLAAAFGRAAPAHLRWSAALERGAGWRKTMGVQMKRNKGAGKGWLMKHKTRRIARLILRITMWYYKYFEIIWTSCCAFCRLSGWFLFLILFWELWQGDHPDVYMRSLSGRTVADL